MNNNEFDPMLRIPSMEELDIQWKQREAARQEAAARESRQAQAKPNRAGNGTRGNMAAGQRQGRTGSTAQRTSSASRGGTPPSHAGRVQGNAKQAARAAQGNVTESETKKKKKTKKPKKFSKFRLFLKVFFLLVLLAILGVLVFFYFRYGNDLFGWKKEAKELVEHSSRDTFRASETSFIYASNKKPIARLRGDKDTAYITFEEIPQEAIDCMVVSEDRDFYEHSGVNFLSTIKAGFLYIKGKLMGDDTITRGGSTITQQLAKNVFLSNEQTEERKIREMFIAIELEQKYTKNEIMEFYLNNICFANGHFGIQAASRAYFSRPVQKLNLAEIAILCAIPNIPTYYDPLQHLDHTQKRKERILNQLLEAEKITATEFSDAMSEEIVLKPAKVIKTQDYMTTYAIRCATKELMKKKGFKFRTEFDSDKEEKKYKKEYDELYEECHNSLYTGGYRIYTTLNPSKQKTLQQTVNDTLAGFTEKTEDGIFTLQGAATCINNKTGFVVAVVGGRKQKSTTGYTLNRAFQSYRQPGSSFKPLVVYTPQLERGYTPDSIVDDTYFEGGPRNSDGTYSGKISLRTAVEKSKNVVAWKLFQELTPQVGLSYVKKMYFSQIVDNDYYPAASLGGLTNGASTVEMASGFATIENDGVYRDPTCIKKIVESDGTVVVKHKKSKDSRQIYEETAARTMTDILTGVMIRGTAAGKGLSDMSCAGKTGTTSDKKDGWFCGFTPYYTTAVWVGYDSPRTLDDLYGSTYPLTIWRTYMEQIHEGLENVPFSGYEEPSGDNTQHYDTEPEDEVTEEPVVDPDAVDIIEEEDDTPEPQVTEPPEEEPEDEPNPEPDLDDVPPDDISEPDDEPDTPPDDVPGGEDVPPDDVPGGEDTPPDDVPNNPPIIEEEGTQTE